jgi:hypothetical protein
MSSEIQIESDWAGLDAAQGGVAAPPATDAGSGTGAYLTDEEILGMEPVGQTLLSAPETVTASAGASTNPSDVTVNPSPLDGQARVSVLPETMPEWMLAAAGDPKHGAQAQQLWQEHQAFRAAFSSPEEARAIKELFPGGAQEAQTLRQAALAVDQLDAAIYSGDSRAQSEVVAELARANPAAFRSLFAEAAKVLAGMGVASSQVSQSVRPLAQVTQPVSQAPTLREKREGWGTQQTSVTSQDPSRESRVAAVTDHEPRVTNHAFDPAAYAAFERSTNDTVARDVRTAVGDTLARVLPEGIAEGAARRIGDDIFTEIHRTLAADRALSEQVGEILRGSQREFTASGWRFGAVEQQRVASLLAGRAKQLVPGVARRVIGEWTSSVLGASRSKAARQASAAARVDVAAPGGSLDSMPLRAMSNREIDYASMSDDEILGM